MPLNMGLEPRQWRGTQFQSIHQRLINIVSEEQFVKKLDLINCNIELNT